MEIEHTPEPWSAGEDNDGWYVEKDGFQIAHGLTEEDALRIVACVNAFEGIPLLELERLVDPTLPIKDRIGLVEAAKQRDELLAALKKLLGHAEGLIEEEYPPSEHAGMLKQFDYVRSAIADAEARQ